MLILLTTPIRAPLLSELEGGAAFHEANGLVLLNFNAAEYCDGLPVTVRFADLVGEILTAGPITSHAPLPFKFYI